MIIHDVEQGTDEWRSLRAGMPTASEFKKLITSKGEPSKSAKKYAMLLAGEKYAKQPIQDFEGNNWTDRGNDLEPDAISTYELISGLDVERIGFVTDDHNRYGCSPDGFVGDDGMVEIKCLKTENHIEALLYYKKYDKSPSDYIAQTQGQLFVCKRQWCDLTFYHPVLPCFSIRQTPDPIIIKGLKIQLASVIAERDSILKELEAFQ